MDGAIQLSYNRIVRYQLSMLITELLVCNYDMNDMFVGVCEKDLAMKCNSKKNPACLTDTKKNIRKKLPNPPLQNLMVRSLHTNIQISVSSLSFVIFSLLCRKFYFL